MRSEAASAYPTTPTPHQTGKADTMSERCEEHGKFRTVANLDHIGNGKYRCRAASACKSALTEQNSYAFAGDAAAYGGGKKGGYGGGSQSTAQLIAQGHSIVHPEEAEVCHAHGKKRSPRQLYQVMTAAGPQWECLVESRCKVSPPGGAGGKGHPPADRYYGGGGQYPRYGGKGGKGGGQYGFNMGYGGGADAGADWCATHRKKRSATCLEMNMATGQYQCKPNEACKEKAPNTGDATYTDPSMGFCTIHGKSRKVMYLVPQEGSEGTFQCAPGRECQVRT